MSDTTEPYLVEGEPGFPGIELRLKEDSIHVGLVHSSLCGIISQITDHRVARELAEMLAHLAGKLHQQQFDKKLRILIAKEGTRCAPLYQVPTKDGWGRLARTGTFRSAESVALNCDFHITGKTSPPKE